MVTEIKMPQLGQTSDEVKFIRWLIKENEIIKRGQPLCEVETDKVNMEMESIAGGTVTKLFAKPEDIISTGTVIAIVEKTQELKKSAPDVSVVKPDLSQERVPFSKKTEDGVAPKAKISGEDASVSYKEAIHQPGIEIKQMHYDFTQTKKNMAKIALKKQQKVKILEEIGQDKAINMLKRMIEIREFEERIRMLFLEGKMPGTIHQYIGQEACAVGVCEALNADDVIASTHRPHGHAIARGIVMKEIMAELYGKITGCCRGKGGSMHIGDIDKGMLPAIAIVGGNIPIAGGMALAFKMRKEPRVSVSFFGDGATNEGAFHEGLNMASMYNVPVVFVCENNIYGASTNIALTVKLENLAERACSYGMRNDIADGMDVLSVYQKAKKLIELARSNQGPSLLELKTFRLCGHSRRDPCNYMTKEEKQYWKSRDPVFSFEQLLIEEKILNRQSLKELRAGVDEEINKAVEFGQNSPEPAPEDTYKDLYITMEVPR